MTQRLRQSLLHRLSVRQKHSLGLGGCYGYAFRHAFAMVPSAKNDDELPMYLLKCTRFKEINSQTSEIKF